MSAFTQSISMNVRRVRAVVQRAWQFNRILTLAIVFQLLLIPLILLGMVFDSTLIVGAPAWNKPMKFALSGAIYAATFLWLLTYVKGRRRWVQVSANVTGIALIIETVLINMQVLRGVPSHYNVSSAFDGAVYSIMGILIFTLALFNLVLAILLLIQGLPNRPFAWAVRFGVLAAFAAMMVGSLMTGQVTPAQRAAFDSAEGPTLVGAHSVGVEMGGPGLPFLGWSTVGGDLRVAHFVGLHGMQALPLLALLLGLPGMRSRFSEARQSRLMVLFGGAYMGWTGLLTWQALRGQSIVAPDAQTWLAYGALVGIVLVGTVLIGFAGRSDGREAALFGASRS